MCAILVAFELHRLVLSWSGGEGGPRSVPHDHDMSGRESDRAESRAPREAGPGISNEALSLLELQAAAGNQAVSRMLGAMRRGTGTPPPLPGSDAVKVQREGLEDSLRMQSGNTTINWDEFAQRLLTIVNRPGTQTGTGTQGSGTQTGSGSGSSLGGGGQTGHMPTAAEQQQWAQQEENEMRRLMGYPPLPTTQTGAGTRGASGGRGGTTPTPTTTGTTPTTCTTPTTGTAPTTTTPTTTGTTPTTGNAPTTTPTTTGTTPTTGTAPTTTPTTTPTATSPTTTTTTPPGQGGTPPGQAKKGKAG